MSVYSMCMSTKWNPHEHTMYIPPYIHTYIHNITLKKVRTPTATNLFHFSFPAKTFL